MGAEVGELVVGLRSNSEAVVDALRAVLAPIRADDVAVYPNLSLYVGEGKGKTRELHRLYRRGATVLSTPSTGRLVRAALRHLDAFLPPPPGLIPLRSHLVVGSRGAVLANEAFVRADLPERRVAKLGWCSTDGAASFLDPATREVVVLEPRLGFDGAALADVDARWPRRKGEDGVAPGRYAIRAVVLLGTGPEHLLAASPARRRAGLASLIDSSAAAVRAADVEAIGVLEERVETVRIPGYETSELVAVLRALSR